MIKRIMVIAVVIATMLVFVACGKTSKKEPHWTYTQSLEVNDDGNVIYSVHTFYSEDEEYARKMAEERQYYYLDKGVTVTGIFEVNEDVRYYQFKVAE